MVLDFCAVFQCFWELKIASSYVKAVKVSRGLLVLAAKAIAAEWIQAICFDLEISGNLGSDDAPQVEAYGGLLG